MADEVVISPAPAAGPAAAPAAPAPVVEVVAPAPTPSPAPVSAEPAPAPVVDAPVAPKVDAVVVDPAAKPTEAPKAADAPKTDAPKTDEPKAADAPKDGEPKPEPVAAEAPKAPEFKIPETLKVDPATMAAYGNVLTKYGISAEAGQELIDFHANTIKTATEQMSQRQLDVFAQTQKDWIADFDKSAGNRRDTILNDAKFAIADTIKDAKERQALWDVLSFTGAGNNKTVINALAKIGKRFRESTGEKQGQPNNAPRNTDPAARRYGPKA